MREEGREMQITTANTPTQNFHQILYDSELNCKERLTMLMFLDTPNGQMDIKYDQLAEKMGVNRSTAITTIRALEDKGYIKCYRKGEKLKRRG